MVRQHDGLAGQHHLGVGDGVPEPGAGHGPRLGERPGHDQARVRCPAQGERAPARELTVRLIDDDEARGRLENSDHGPLRLGPAGRVVGRAQEGDLGLRAGQEGPRRLGVDAEVLRPPALDHGGPGQPADVRVQGIGRLEHRGPAAGPPVRQQEALQHLVGAVGAEHLLGRHPVQRGDGGAQLGGRPVGIAVEGHLGQRPGGPGSTPRAAGTATRWC